MYKLCTTYVHHQNFHITLFGFFIVDWIVRILCSDRKVDRNHCLYKKSCAKSQFTLRQKKLSITFGCMQWMYLAKICCVACFVCFGQILSFSVHTWTKNLSVNFSSQLTKFVFVRCELKRTKILWGNQNIPNIIFLWDTSIECSQMWLTKFFQVWTFFLEN
jgi:hypothetical protein